MKKIILFEILTITILFSISCNKEQTTQNKQTNYLSSFDSISSQKYYSTDIINDNYKKLYGTWKVIGSSGGIHGQGYTIDFDYLIFKPNGIFGVIKNDKLINYGKLDIKNQTDKEFFANFIPENLQDENQIYILSDPEKIFVFYNDTLFLNSPCCDRFNTILKKQEKSK